MNKVVEVLMNRDGMTKKEAESKVAEVKEMIADANGDYEEVEAIVSEELGLEMDYIFDLT